MQWICGGCGQLHGWACPYFGNPGRKLTKQELQAANQKLEEDRKLGKIKPASVIGSKK